MSCENSTYAGVSGAVSFVGGYLGNKYGKNFGKAFATFLTGQNETVATFANLIEKAEAGKATWEDYVSVALPLVSVVASFAFLAGGLRMVCTTPTPPCFPYPPALETIAV